MKSSKLKKVVSSIVSLLLVMMMVFFVFAPHVFAQDNNFTGVETLEAKENETIDLLKGVAAASPEGEVLQVTVKNVTCETDANYKYDNSGVLEAGKAGSIYHVEYEASSDKGGMYSTTREIIVVSEEQAFEEKNENVSGTLSEENAAAKEGGIQISFENGIHYIEDPNYPGKKLTLFCMNNKLHWPHHIEDMGETQVPNYVEGYLTPDNFKSQQAYEECMRRLSKLLYAGYPYNGERLYKIVKDSSKYAPTEEEFNDMLIVPAVLQTAYPYLGHHDFTYADWKNSNKEHLEELRQFVGAVIKLNVYGGTTSNGLTYEDIEAMPFYKAAFSIINCNDNTPLETFQLFYGAKYFVTEEEAYNATQNAIWHLLYEYGIPDNDLSTMSLPLSSVLYTYSERGGLLNYKPSSDEIEIVGDLNFEYNPKDGMYHSGKLKIIEPEIYRGIYHLKLPKGVTAQCDNLTYVYGNEEYELVSDHLPTINETFMIEGKFDWLQEVKQYSPLPDIEFEGKKFQHMIGAVINRDEVRVVKAMGSDNEGSVSITKQVIGEANCDKEFKFTLTLPYHTDDVNGKYGDLNFEKGVAKFALKAGETKIAEHLPYGAWYIVEEDPTTGYRIGMTNQSGEVPLADIVPVTFTNTKLPDLSLSKTVTGEMGNKTKKFEFVINLKDKDGKPVGTLFDKSFEYKGSVIDGTGAEPPKDGSITFKKGEARISLSHGQKITIKDLPYGSAYTVKEVKEDADPYKVTYKEIAVSEPGTTPESGTNPESGVNPKSGTTPESAADSVTGKLEQDKLIEVVNEKESVPSTGITNHTNRGMGIGVLISLGALGSLLVVGLFYWRKGWKK